MEYTALSPAQPAAPPVYTVSQVTTALQTCLERCYHNLYIRGEISSLTIHPSSHVFFTLKEGGALLNACAYRYAFHARQMRLAVGMQVVVTGYLTYYSPGAQCQLQVKNITLDGEGEEARRLAELYNRLQSRGCFDATRKRILPAFPKVIGLLTARDGAGKGDFLEKIYQAKCGLRICFVPVTVQGARARESIIKSLNFLNQHTDCEFIVLTRGGGAKEDLAIFNDEAIVNAIFHSPKPVLTAIGHERDRSFADEAADLSCITPTAAGVHIVQPLLTCRVQFHSIDHTIRQSIDAILRTRRDTFASVLNHDALKRPGSNWLTPRRDSLERAEKALRDALLNRLQRHRNTFALLLQTLDRIPETLITERKRRLNTAGAVLEALNPTAVLNRGYAILVKDDGSAVRTPSDVRPGERLTAQLATGTLTVLVPLETP